MIALCCQTILCVSSNAILPCADRHVISVCFLFLLGIGIRHGRTEILPNEFGVLNDIGANLIEIFYFSPIILDYIIRGVLEIIFETFKRFPIILIFI